LQRRAAVFIDGGYLDNVLLHYGKAKIDYEKMVQDLTGENPLLRAYYYHCLPYQSAEPTPEEKQKFSSAERFLRRL